MRRSLALLLSLVLLPQVALAQTETQDAAPDAEGTVKVDTKAADLLRKQRSARHPVRSRISRYLEATAETLDEGTTDDARELLGKLNVNRLNPYERALVLRLQAYVEYQAGAIEEAIGTFRRVLAEEILSVKEENEIRWSIAQLYTAVEQWQNAIDAVSEWARWVPERTPESHYLVAIAYYQLEQMDQALAYAEKSVDQSPEPKESWLTLLAALYVKNEDYANAAPVLEELVMKFRKKQYWSQLSLIYGARDDFKGSLAVQQIAYEQGFLTTDKELVRLARGYLYNDLPHPAAKVLETGLENGIVEPSVGNYELLAQSWIAAREYDKSLVPLRKAAELSENGNLNVRLGQVHLQREEWGEAVAQLQEAIRKGDLKEPGNAHLLLGIALYNEQQIARARASFARARKHDETKTAADNWLGHIEKETKKSS